MHDKPNYHYGHDYHADRAAYARFAGWLSMLAIERSAGGSHPPSHHVAPTDGGRAATRVDEPRMINQTELLRTIGERLNGGKPPSPHTLKNSWIPAGHVPPGRHGGKETLWTEHELEAAIIRIEALGVWP